MAALMGGMLATTAWAADGDGSVDAAAENPEMTLVASLTGEAEVLPPDAPDPTPDDATDVDGDPDGAGAVTITVNAATGEVCAVVVTGGIDPITMAHIHAGAPDEAGPPVVDLSPTSPANDYTRCATATVTVAQQIVADPGAYYFNVHNTPYPAGALRGQLAETAGAVGGLVMLPEPVRAYDSRVGTDGPLAVDTARTVDLSMGMGGTGSSMVAVPPGAGAALVTLTATQTGSAGYLRLFSNALIGQPATSTINWANAGTDIATTTAVAVDSGGRIKVAAGGSGTHFVVDVIGYYSVLGANAAS